MSEKKLRCSFHSGIPTQGQWHCVRQLAGRLSLISYWQCIHNTKSVECKVEERHGNNNRYFDIPQVVKELGPVTTESMGLQLHV